MITVAVYSVVILVMLGSMVLGMLTLSSTSSSLAQAQIDRARLDVAVGFIRANSRSVQGGHYLIPEGRQEDGMYALPSYFSIATESSEGREFAYCPVGTPGAAPDGTTTKVVQDTNESSYSVETLTIGGQPFIVSSNYVFDPSIPDRGIVGFIAMPRSDDPVICADIAWDGQRFTSTSSRSLVRAIYRFDEHDTQHVIRTSEISGSQTLNELMVLAQGNFRSATIIVDDQLSVDLTADIYLDGSSADRISVLGAMPDPVMVNGNFGVFAQDMGLSWKGVSVSEASLDINDGGRLTLEGAHAKNILVGGNSELIAKAESSAGSVEINESSIVVGGNFSATSISLQNSFLLSEGDVNLVATEGVALITRNSNLSFQGGAVNLQANVATFRIEDGSRVTFRDSALGMTSPSGASPLMVIDLTSEILLSGTSVVGSSNGAFAIDSFGVVALTSGASLVGSSSAGIRGGNGSEITIDSSTIGALDNPYTLGISDDGVILAKGSNSTVYAAECFDTNFLSQGGEIDRNNNHNWDCIN